MIYYFVSPDGDYLTIEANARGWFDKEMNPDMFTQKRKAQAEQKRRMKLRIAELKTLVKEIK